MKNIKPSEDTGENSAATAVEITELKHLDNCQHTYSLVKYLFRIVRVDFQVKRPESELENNYRIVRE